MPGAGERQFRHGHVTALYSALGRPTVQSTVRSMRRLDPPDWRVKKKVPAATGFDALRD
jgi:hypothetical protein